MVVVLLAADQYAWLEAELADSSAAIKLVVGHHPVYSVGNYAPGTDSLAEYVHQYEYRCILL